MKSVFRAIAASTALFLSGCFVSETPLFETMSARATPIPAGDYDACSGSTEDDAVDCSPMTVALSEDDRYTFGVEDDFITAYFVPIDEDDFAVQMDDGGDGDYHYYWGRLEDGALTLVMLWCDDLPRALVDQLVADGAVETDENYSTCTAKTASAALLAVKAYAAGEVADQNWVKLSPAAIPQ